MALPPPPTQIVEAEVLPLQQQIAPVQTQAVQKLKLAPEIVQKLVLNGDLSGLDQQQKLSYYLYRCDQLGLDPATKPFDLLVLKGREVLYANKTCATQLRDMHKISTKIIEEREWNGLLSFRVRAWFQDGRQHEDEGFATVHNLQGDMLGNARLKALTKATRRAILNLCGLGELDETEVETIPGAKKASSAVEEAKAILESMNQPTKHSQAIKVVDFKDNQVVDEADGRIWDFDPSLMPLVKSVVGTDKLLLIEAVDNQVVNAVVMG